MVWNSTKKKRWLTEYPNNSEMKKSLWQKILVAIGLKLLRFAGRRPLVHESKEQVFARRASYIPELDGAGYSVKQLTPYQYRINGFLDVYPVNARFHDIRTGKRGSFHGQNLASFVRRYLQEI